MIDSFFNAVKFFVIFSTVGISITVLIVIILKAKEFSEDKKRKREEKEKDEADIALIISASRKWTREQKLGFMDYLSEEYEKLERAYNRPIGNGFACKTIIIADIFGKAEFLSVDLDGIRKIYNYLDVTLDD